MHVVIIGNGISGTTTARWIRKLSDHKVTIISSESEHFYSRTALMYIYMGHMRYDDTKPYEDHFWEKNRIHLVQGHVSGIDFTSKTLGLSDGKSITYDQLVLALGSKPNKFGWPGQDLLGVSGLYSLQDLAAIEEYSTDLQRAVVVGGGLIGIELAEMFHSRHIPVTMLVREDSYWDIVLPKEESIMIGHHIKKHGIDLRLGVNLDKIIDSGQGRAKGIIIKETQEEIECGFVGLTAGVHPNVQWLKESPLEIDRGILVDGQLKTNIEDVYAIGDCAESRSPKPSRRPIEAIWYTGRMMGEVCAHNVCGATVDYDPGLWFNSAKFFDIEYQVYGHMPSITPDHIQTLYWRHPQLEKSVRINYHKEDQYVTGFNLMGVRMRHEVCEKWILEKADIRVVIKELSLTNFDPEFFKKHERDISLAFSKQSGITFEQPKQKTLDQVLAFLKR